MSAGSPTFGARLAAAAPQARFALHSAEADRSAFADYDRVLAAVFDRAIRGTQILDVARAERRTDNDIVTLRVSYAERETISELLSPAAQQARGGWYLPEAGDAPAGIIQLAYWTATEPRFSISAADAQRAKVKLDAPDAILVWAALEPVMELLWLPLKLRSGYWLGGRRPDQMAKDWASVDATYATLGLDVGPLEVFKDGGRWATLTIDEVIAARDALMRAWQRAPEDVGERALVLLISRLVERYYLKAKNGMAQRTKVMNKGLERALSGAFGGDWLALVRYLGEPVHPAEQIATAVEPTSLLVSGQARIAEAAVSTGVPVEEIERMLSSYWGGQSDSPVETRVELMREWWRAFDELHARQRPGMPSLWGLLGDRYEHANDSFGDVRYTRRGYELLPPEINRRVEELWATTVLPRWPGALVTEPYPQAAFAEMLGPAVDFWHGAALTCWFICEGPYSRTDIAGMSDYYDRQLKALDDLGCPVDPALFAELGQAETKLTDRPPPPQDSTEHDLGNGISFSITISTGQVKKDGFEYLRDVVTRHRRAWASEHLARYLQQRWEQDLRKVGDAYHRHVADKAKVPTAKQFAVLGAETANRWFGGDLTALASALGLPSAEPPTYAHLMPADHAALVARMRELLGGQRWEDTAEDMDRDERTRRLRRSELAEHAPQAVQLWEATGSPPPMKLASWARYRVEAAFGEDTEAGWQTYLDALTRALDEVRALPGPDEERSALGGEQPVQAVQDHGPLQGGEHGGSSVQATGASTGESAEPSPTDRKSPSHADVPGKEPSHGGHLRDLLSRLRG